jgi:hypothetical protein
MAESLHFQPLRKVYIFHSRNVLRPNVIPETPAVAEVSILIGPECPETVKGGRCPIDRPMTAVGATLPLAAVAVKDRKPRAP